MRAVELFDDERALDHGMCRTLWYVRLDGDWIQAARFPGARAERHPTPPGTVWRRRLELLLPNGTELMRVESAPPRRSSAKPLDYLQRRPKARETVRRHYFRVGRSGVVADLRQKLKRP